MRLLVLLPALSLFAVWSSNARSQGQAEGDGSQQLSPRGKVPSGVLLVKGAWASASDATTPVPEGGTVTSNEYSNPYFSLTYPLLRDWVKKYDGPPPSDSGYYVLAQLQPRDTVNGVIPGSLIMTAADLFFTPVQATSALQFINSSRSNLHPDFKVSREPTRITLAGRSFVRFDYFSPVAGLHWYVLATQIRCHVVQFVFTSRDMKLLNRLLEDIARIQLPEEAALTAGTGGIETPVCIKDYASARNIVERVDPILMEHRFNPIPVRVIINREGRIRHIHFLSAFADQSQAITEALHQWKFNPYLRDGQPMEVETGIMFGRTSDVAPPPLHMTTAPITAAK